MPQGGQAYELSRSGELRGRLAKINAEIEAEDNSDQHTVHFRQLSEIDSINGNVI